MTTAAPAAPQSGAAEAGRRLGVRAKLMLSFAGMAAMTVAASAVGLMSFSAVERPMAHIADTSLPEMELATRLAGESGAIASAAPMLDGAASQEERERLHAEATERARGFLSLVDWDDRKGEENTAQAIARRATKALSSLRDVDFYATVPPAVRGPGKPSCPKGE